MPLLTLINVPVTVCSPKPDFHSVRESSRFMAKGQILTLDSNGFSPDLRRKAIRC